MKTGAEYKASLKDGRATYFEGERVDDLAAHAILGQSVEIIASGYERAKDLALKTAGLSDPGQQQEA